MKSDLVKPKPKRATIKDVAVDAKVSVAAVSKVLRGAYGVSDSLRQKVRTSMVRLDYRPLASARGMRGRTFTLGVVFPDIRNPFFGNILNGINAAVEGTQYQPFIGVGRSAQEVETALVDSIVDRQMDGIIFISPHLPRAAVEGISRRLPLVVIGHHCPDAELFDTVNNDDVLGAFTAVSHLIEGGKKRVAMLASSPIFGNKPDPVMVSVQREIGYNQAMQKHGLTDFISVHHANQSLSEIRSTTEKMLTGSDIPDAIFCWTDFAAFEVIGLAQKLGFRIPEDLKIVGYDNTMYCDLTQNNLTSVDQSGEQLGEESVRLLLERINGRENAEHFVAVPQLVVRSSSTLGTK